MELFGAGVLPPALIDDLRRQNPWWAGDPLRPLPSFRRWPYTRLRRRLDSPLAPIQVVRGPRQIGKTTLQLQIIEALLSEGVAPQRILRVQFDDLPSLRRLPVDAEPILRIIDWFERAILTKHLNQAARDGAPAFLFFDEVQNLNAWDAQLKSLVDHTAVRVFVTGSSALRIELGRDSLAGRIQTLEVGPLRLAEIAALRGLGALRVAQEDNGLEQWLSVTFWKELIALSEEQAQRRDAAFAAFSERGAYPFAQTNPDISWPEVSEHLTETVVRRVIQHDLRLGERGRKRDQALLEEVFRLACRYAGQAPSPALLAREVQATLQANVGPERIRHYLNFLDSSLLLRTIPAAEIRLKKQRAPAKLCLSDPAIRAAWLQETIPLEPDALQEQPTLAPLAGHIAESVVGYFLASLPGLSLAHLPERPGEPEIDFVVTLGAHRIPIEVKYQRRVTPADAAGLVAYLDKPVNNAPLGLIITPQNGTTTADPRIVALSLPTLLLVR